jgi:glycerophosphoryl diester phosphodiesterase
LGQFVSRIRSAASLATSFAVLTFFPSSLACGVGTVDGVDESGTDESGAVGETGGSEETGGETGPPGLFSDRVLNIAHRGGAGEFPEHTMIAYQGALDVGTHMLEIDVHRTVDGELVLMHDDTVDRTTDGSGLIADMTLSDLKALDAAYEFTLDGGQTYPYRGTGVAIPTPEEVFAAFPEALFVIEIKPAQALMVEEMLTAIDDAGVRENVILGSFNENVLDEIRLQAPDVHTSLSVGEVVEFAALTDETEAGYTPPALFLQVPIELMGITVLTPARVRRADRFGMRVQAWTINDEDEMRMLLDWGVHGIMTDLPSVLDAVLSE